MFCQMTKKLKKMNFSIKLILVIILLFSKGYSYCQGDINNDNVIDYQDISLGIDHIMHIDLIENNLFELLDFNSDQKQVLSACVDGLQQPGFNDSSQAYADLLESICTSLKVGKGKVFKPIRLALTGRGSGPLITDVLAFFGKERVIERLQLTIA